MKLANKVSVIAVGCVAWAGLNSAALAEESAANRPPPVEVQLERYAGTELEDDVECRQIQRTGTRIAWTVCLTDIEWDYIREESRQTMETLRGSGTETGT